MQTIKNISQICIDCIVHNYIRSWYDAWAIAHARAITRTNEQQGGLGGP